MKVISHYNSFKETEHPLGAMVTKRGSMIEILGFRRSICYLSELQVDLPEAQVDWWGTRSDRLQADQTPDKQKINKTVFLDV